MSLRATSLTILAVLCGAAPAVHAAAPTTARTVAAARTLGVGPEAQRLRGRFLPAARLVRTGGAAPRRLGATHLGGSPDLPAGTRWPTCNGHPLSLLEQIDLAALNRAVPGQTRGRGTLAIFVGLGTDARGNFDLLAIDGRALRTGSCVAVVHTPPGRRLVARATPKGAKTLPRTAVRLRPTLTVPEYHVADKLLGRKFDLAFANAWDRLTRRATTGDLSRPAPAAPLRQLLGWSLPRNLDPTLLPPCHGVRPVRLLAQFDSDAPFDLDDTAGGSLLLTLPAADLRAGRFDRICAEDQLD